MDAVTEINRTSALIEDDMSGAQEIAQVLLLCDEVATSVIGWSNALLRNHILFDMLPSYQVSLEGLQKYVTVILSKGYAYDNDNVFRNYVSVCGNLMVEGYSKAALRPVLDMLGVESDNVSSEPLTASFLRVEEPGSPLIKDQGETVLIPHRGRVGYCTPKTGVTVQATLVPPFAPLNRVGVPHERTSLASYFCPAELINRTSCSIVKCFLSKSFLSAFG